MTIAYHLKATHTNLSTAQRHFLTQKWAAINASTPDDEVGLTRAQTLGYHADLELFQAEFGCGVRGCLFAAKTRDTVVKHAIDDHADVKEAKELPNCISLVTQLRMQKGERDERTAELRFTEGRRGLRDQGRGQFRSRMLAEMIFVGAARSSL